MHTMAVGFGLVHSLLSSATLPNCHRKPLLLRNVAAGCFRAVASSSPAPWRTHWQKLLQQLHGAGLFEADPHVSESDLGADAAAVKRAVLRFARQRPDILAALDGAQLKRLVAAGVPVGETDRKTRNAWMRLEASILRGQHLAPGGGGAADLQDVLRMVLALDAASKANPGEEQGELAAAAGAVLPTILGAAMAARPGAEVQISEKARHMERMKQGGGRGRPGSNGSQWQGAERGPWDAQRREGRPEGRRR